MRVRETTKRKDKRFNLEKNRYLSHFYRYTPSGEELPENMTNAFRKRFL